MRNNKKHTFDEVKKYIESFGYKLLSTKYIQCDKKIIFQCPEGHIYNTSYSIFRSGSRCPICVKKNCNRPTKHSYQYVKEYFASFEYRLISKEYINCKHKLDVLCPDGHNYSISFSKFRDGIRCPKCHNLSITGEGNPYWKGGVMTISTYLRNDDRYLQWQKESEKRYGRRCLITNKYTTTFHHLYPFHLIVKNVYGDKIKNRTPLNLLEVNTSLSNKFFKQHNKYYGIPLSIKLHREFHKIYGYFNFTKENFEEFYFNKTGKRFIIKP